MTTPHRSDDNGDDRLRNRLHHVLVFGVPDDPHQLRDLLVEHLELNSIDAQFLVHNLPGILPRPLVAHRAARLAEAIRDLGVSATALPLDEVPSFERLETIHHLRCDDEFLKVLDLRGDVTAEIAYRDISLLSVGLVPRPSEHLTAPVATVATQLANPHRSSQSTPVDKDSLQLLLVTSNPDRLLRIDHALMNYEYLDRRISTSATVNFRLLVQDLVHRSPDTTLTPATTSFLEHGLARHYEFGSLDEMKRYTLFHLTIRDLVHGCQIGPIPCASKLGSTTDQQPVQNSEVIDSESEPSLDHLTSRIGQEQSRET